MKNILFLIILSTFGLESCHEAEQLTDETDNQPPKETTTTELSEIQYKNAGIETGTIENRTLSNVLKVNGKIVISPDKQVSISAPMGGFVRKINVSSGQKIQKGMEVAVIENQEFIQMQQDYAETRSRLEFAEADFKRQTELSQENVSAKKTLEMATSEVKTLRARLSALEQKLLTTGISPAAVQQGLMTNKISLRSPQTGFVTIVNVNSGKFVNPADILFEIINTSEPLAELTVFEQDVPKIKVGQKVRLQLSNQINQERTAYIQAVTPKIGEDRTVKIRAKLTAGNENLFPETFLKGLIELDQNPVPSLPEEAVVTFEGKNYIFVTKGKKGENYVFEITEVQKGISENGFTEISLPEGVDVKSLQIVKKGAYNLLAKMKNAGEEE